MYHIPQQLKTKNAKTECKNALEKKLQLKIKKKFI